MDEWMDMQKNIIFFWIEALTWLLPSLRHSGQKLFYTTCVKKTWISPPTGFEFQAYISDHSELELGGEWCRKKSQRLFAVLTDWQAHKKNSWISYLEIHMNETKNLANWSILFLSTPSTRTAATRTAPYILKNCILLTVGTDDILPRTTGNCVPSRIKRILIAHSLPSFRKNIKNFCLYEQSAKNFPEKKSSWSVHDVEKNFPPRNF
jgi:hypothetical protein